MDLRNLPPQKKNLGINQCEEKGGGGYYIPVGSVYLKKSESSVSGMKEYTCLHSEPAVKGRKKKKKNLVLTLGSLPEKGGKKKNPWY
jgi:hypothetical protein